MEKLKVISLFAGAGGMDLGFIQSGFNIIWANDFNSDAVETYKKNIGDHIVLGDITTIKTDEIKGEPEEVDVVIGGFPCQGFSVANTRRSMEDKRNFLYLEMLRVIREKKPKFFLAENVKGLLSMEKGRVIDMILNDFSELGYNVDYKVLNAADYGVPQARERIFIMGNRIGVDNIFPQKTHGNIDYKEEKESNNQLTLDCLDEIDVNLISKNEVAITTEYREQWDLKPYITVKEAIGFLSDVELVNGKVNQMIEVGRRKVYNHIGSTKVGDTFWARKYDVNQEEICDYLRYWRTKKGISVKKVDEYFGYKHTAGHWFRKDNKSGSIPKPSDWWKLKELLGFDDKYDKQVTTFIQKEIKFEQSLRITNWDRPSDTITATSPEIHINKQRRLSVRECAILQTFPDDHIFQGSLSSQYRQVGNAVPVKLARLIAQNIKNQII